MSDIVVSCIMPTRSRRAWIPLAVRCWLEQDYPAIQRELVVIDDGPDPVGTLLPDSPRVRYIHLMGHNSIGAKINLGCSMARGDLLTLWADDDYHASWRLTYQVGMMQCEFTALGGLATISGCDSMLSWDVARDEMWLYQFVPGKRTLGYVCGGTMMFRRSFWLERPFDDTSFGEDTRFIQGRTPVLGTLNYHYYVATLHNGNTAPKRHDMRLASEQWIQTGKPVSNYAAPWWIDAVRAMKADA